METQMAPPQPANHEEDDTADDTSSITGSDGDFSVEEAEQMHRDLDKSLPTRSQAAAPCQDYENLRTMSALQLMAKEYDGVYELAQIKEQTNKLECSGAHCASWPMHGERLYRN